MAIQMRRGEKKDFKPEKLKVGEFAVPTDTGEVYIKTSEDVTKGIATLKSSGKLEQMPTYSDVGAAPKNHASSDTAYGVSTTANYGHAMASSTTPLVAGTANVGTETAKFARGDHIHPVQTNVSGNAGTATKLQTARTIATSGGATGTATSFDGSANITIPITDINPSYLSSATPINKGGTGATTASEALSNLGAVPASRTINNKDLSSNITLTPGDIGASAEGHTHTFSSLTSKPTTLAGYGITDAVMNSPSVVSLIIPTTGWNSDSNTSYPHYYDISVTGVTAKDRAEITIAPSSLGTAAACGLCPTNETMTDKIRVRSTSIPQADIDVEYWLENGRE